MKYSVFWAILGAVLIPNLVQAQSPQVSVNFVSQPLVYGQDFDVVALDFRVGAMMK